MKIKLYIRAFILIVILFLIWDCSRMQGPGIKFSSRFYNFGEINEGEKVSYSFTYTNPGTDILKITKVKPTCGCTVPGDYTKEILPGRTGEIPLVFNSKGFQGKVTKTIKVETNIPESEPISLTIEGKIKVLIETDPKNLWLGQTRIDGPPITGSVIVKNHVDSPLQIGEIITTGEKTETQVQTIVPGKEYRIELRVIPPFNLGQIREFLKIHTNIEGKEVIEIQYHYYGISDIEVAPKEIIIYKKHLNPDLVRILTIKSHTDALIEVKNPKVTIENLDISLEEQEPGKHIQIILQFKEGFAFPENGSTNLTFIIKSEGVEKAYTVPIRDSEKM